MKKISTLLLAISMSGFLYAQSISRSVIASAGDYNSNGNISISWTLGEIATETLIGSNITLTQGFQQPDTMKAVYVIPGFPDRNLDIKVYPNPATEFIKILLKGNDDLDLQVELYDAIGRELMVSKVYAGENEKSLDVTAFRPGIYFLKIATSNGTAIRTYQVAKVK